MPARNAVRRDGTPCLLALAHLRGNLAQALGQERDTRLGLFEPLLGLHDLGGEM